MSSETMFVAAVDLYLTPLFGTAARFDGPNSQPVDKWSNLRVAYRKNDWLVAPVFNVDERTVDVEFANSLSAKKPFSLHIYMRLVDPARYYELGAAICHTDDDIKDIVVLYASAISSSAKRGHPKRVDVDRVESSCHRNGDRGIGDRGHANCVDNRQSDRYVSSHPINSPV